MAAAVCGLAAEMPAAAGVSLPVALSVSLPVVVSETLPLWSAMQLNPASPMVRVLCAVVPGTKGAAKGLRDDPVGMAVAAILVALHVHNKDEVRVLDTFRHLQTCFQNSNLPRVIGQACFFGVLGHHALRSHKTLSGKRLPDFLICLSRWWGQQC